MGAAEGVDAAGDVAALRVAMGSDTEATGVGRIE